MHSSWRTPLVVVLALAGAVIAARLAAFQLGWQGPPPEPFFGAGAVRVLTSRFSRALPVPDALLGMLAYLGEAVVVAADARLGSHTRLFAVASGIAALLLALGGIVLTSLQAFVIHAFCTTCLASAALSLLIAALTVPHAVAAARASDRPLLRV